MDPRILSARQAPDTPAWGQLGRLLNRRGELTAAVDDLDAQQRAASEAAQAAAASVADLQRRELGGEEIGADQRRKAEQTLQRARVRVAEPWPERRSGATAAVADLDRRLQLYVGEHFDDLADGLREQGLEAAHAVDEAATRLLTAYQWREETARRMSALSSAIGQVRPGDVSYTRAEGLANEARRLLDGGGERAPDLRDPRLPRHGQVPAVA